MVWYAHLFKNFPQFVVIHAVKGFGIVNKAEIDVFVELSCFFDNPVYVGNLIIAKEFSLWTLGLVHVKVSLKKSATHFLLTNISALYSSQNSIGFFCLKTHAFWNQIREIKFIISSLSF